MLTTGGPRPFRSPQVIPWVDASFHRVRQHGRMTIRTVVSVAGALVVAAYAALLALDQLVLDPLTLVPGRSLAGVYDRIGAAGNDPVLDVVGVLVLAAIGAGLGVGVAVAGLRRALPTHVVAVLHLGVLVLGGLATVPATFLLGMDVLDSFAVTADHTPWLHVLWMTSLLALAAVPAVLFGEMVRSLRRLRAQRTTPAA